MAETETRPRRVYSMKRFCVCSLKGERGSDGSRGVPGVDGLHGLPGVKVNILRFYAVNLMPVFHPHVT